MALSLERYDYYGNSHFTYLLKERCRKEREKSMLIAIKKIDHLPENLIFDILSWLPVKDLLQYKSVNKTWYAIISSPNFISKHLKNYYYNNDDWRRCLLVKQFATPAELQLLELFVDETCQVLAKKVLDHVPSYGAYVYGPCDGLYYVYNFNNSFRGLWNPATNEFEPLPNIVSKPDLPAIFAPGYEHYGLGLDPITDDYKVVVIHGYQCTMDNDEDIKHPLSVVVYSLRTNSWRYCGDLSKAYILERNQCYIYVNGCCYWFGSYNFISEVIISFNFATDAYKEIDVPDYAQPSSKRLGVYDNFLALYSLKENKIFDIWTMNDEGSWTKKLTTGPFPGVWVPISHWKDNMLILQNESDYLSLFDPETQGVKSIGFLCNLQCQGVYAYMESLVSIKKKRVGAD